MEMEIRSWRRPSRVEAQPLCEMRRVITDVDAMLKGVGSTDDAGGELRHCGMRGRGRRKDGEMRKKKKEEKGEKRRTVQ